MEILQTTNPTWGFFGAFSHHDTDPTAAWPPAMEAIAKATGCPAKDVRKFLDSSQGRIFAEGVIKLMSENFALKCAVDAVVERWMHLKILTGFVRDCELKADIGEGRVH